MKTNRFLSHRYACPCCGYLTLSLPSPGSFDICFLCGWEDDKVQYSHPFLQGGANRLSLHQEKKKFQQNIRKRMQRKPLKGARPCP